jgi:carboxymethylenebutenolidase
MAETAETVATHDGGKMPVAAFRPASGSGPGLVMLQEIFGVTDYIKHRARDLLNLSAAGALVSNG